MKKSLLVLAVAALMVTGCNKTVKVSDSSQESIIASEVDDSSSEETTLGKVTNLQYNNGVISFTGVSGATDYLLIIKLGNVVKHQKGYATTSIDISSLELEGGHYNASVTARKGNLTSEPATLEFKVLHVDRDLILEAEDGLLDMDRNYSADPDAHGGAYGLAFNDCGQGMYFRYFAFEAGARNITVRYSTGSPNSYMTLFANSISYKVDYTENTGWFGDSKTSAEVVVENVTLLKGWNELYLIKNGSSTDNPAYGGWAQVDYIKVAGTGKTFDLDEVDMSANRYQLEAEMAHWHYADENQRPVDTVKNWSVDTFSLGFGLGEINAVGDGAKFSIYIRDDGNYLIRPAIGQSASVNINLSIDNGADETVAFNPGSSWDHPALVGGVEKTLSKGMHTIDFKRTEGNAQWFTFDYLVIEKVVA